MFAGIRNLHAINSIAVINGGQFIGLMDCRHSPQYPPTKQTRDIHPVLVECWASVVDGGPTFNQQWVNVSCLLESQLSLPVRFPYNTTRRYNAKAKYFVQHRANIHLLCGMGYADGRDGTIINYNICTCTTSAQRLRRWSYIVQMLYKCFVFTGNG